MLEFFVLAPRCSILISFFQICSHFVIIIMKNGEIKISFAPSILYASKNAQKSKQLEHKMTANIATLIISINYTQHR